ncbi:hypothetical protein D3C71_2235770 [compost metagenome]
MAAKIPDNNRPPMILPMAANGRLRVMLQVIDNACMTRSPSQIAGPTMEPAT